MGWREISEEGGGGDRLVFGCGVGWFSIVGSRFLWLGDLDGRLADSYLIVDTRDSCVMTEMFVPRTEYSTESMAVSETDPQI